MNFDIGQAVQAADQAYFEQVERNRQHQELIATIDKVKASGILTDDELSLLKLGCGVSKCSI